MMKHQSWRLSGGLNLVRPAITRHRVPGELVGCMNYEVRDEGCRRIDGYERFDGRPAPSYILDDEPGEEDIEAEKRRALIEPVPGDKLLGVWRYRDRTYAFSLAGDEIRMYGSSADGWARVTLGWRVAFTAGGGAAPEEGEEFASSGDAAEGVVIGHYLTSGTWAGGDAAGVLVFAYDGAGRFAASDVVTVEATAARTLTLSAVPAAQTVGAADASEYSFGFVNHNFFGVADRARMYGVSGAGNPFEFNGTMFLELSTGVTASHPTHLAVHEQHLFVGYPEGAITYSGTGLPRSFDANDGAGEIAIGDTLTDLLAGYRGSLFLFGRNLTAYLTGTSNADFAIRTLSPEAGAMHHTVVMMDQPTCLDDRGIRNVVATDAYGDFEIGTMSKPIRPLLDFKRSGAALPVAATRIRRKSQYRVWFDDGDCIVMNYVRRGNNLSAEYTRFSYDLYEKLYDPEQPGANYGRRIGILTSVCSIEDSDGRERVFFAMRASMYVYEMDAGKSFDSHPIPYFLRLPYNDFGAPFMIKRYRKLLIEVDSSLESTFFLTADFGDEAQEGERQIPHTVTGPSSFWSEGDWSAAYWDLVPVRHAEQRLHGRGRNLSVMLYSRPDVVEESHVVNGITVYYEPRRMQR